MSASSSDGESNFHTSLNFPDLQNYKKHHKRRTSSSNINIVKAGKKIVNNTSKAVRFPEKRPGASPRQSFISGGSSLNSTNANLSDSDSDADLGSADGDLPHFQFQSGDIQDELDSDSLIPYEDDGDRPDQLAETDSDEDDDERSVARGPEMYHDEEKGDRRPSHSSHGASHEGVGSRGGSMRGSTRGSVHGDGASSRDIGPRKSVDSHTSKQSRSSRNHFFRRPSIMTSNSRQRGETDITDQLGSVGSNPSSNTQSKSAAKFREILRKVALTDQQYPEPPSRSDSLIGRLVQNDNDHFGLSGGGLVPGASRNSRERPIDEEEELGINDPDGIELQKLNFSQLNDEARNLINVHLPEHLQAPVYEPGQETSNDMMIDAPGGSSSDTVAREKEEAQAAHDDHHLDRTRSRRSERRSVDSIKEREGLYAPNPDLYLRGDVQHNDDHEFMMLDNDSETNIAPPKKIQAGVLSSLLKLYQNPDESKSTASLSFGDTSTINDFDEHERAGTSHGISLAGMKSGIKHGGKRVYGNMPFVKRGTNNTLNPNSDEDEIGDTNVEGLPNFANAKPKLHKKATTQVNPSEMPSRMTKKLKKAKKKQDRQLHITVHIADVLQRQRFIMLMCKAFMLFGAPTHRLEEYMVMTSRVLEIDGQFIYLPGCMIMAFGDAATRTSEVHLVKCSQGVNLSKLSEAHRIYKAVIHDLMGVEEASAKLVKVLKLKNNYNPWLCVLFYGLGSAAVCPFAFGGGWVDIPIAFGVGLCVGYLQFFVSSMSNLYSSVFEVTSSIVVSFIARGIGSINGGDTFCFSAIVQGSLALILPGYIILCGSLELQSRNLVAGAVRMFYAVIYSLFLGFGITLGAALYGWVDKNSTSETQCPAHHTLDDKWRILLVPAFTCCLGLINQASFRQLPVMIFIAATGYVGNYFAAKHFHNVTEFTAAIGAFIIGILGNLYSRIGKGLAVSAMLPAIFVQVPSGIASQSSLLAGVQAADRITSNTTLGSQNSGSLSFGVTMVEVSIGISVGLFAAALFIYPFGKKRTGLFSL